MTTASPYYNRFDIKVIGEACHAGHTERGLNALKMTTKALNKVTLGRVDENTLCNIGIISGGYARNTIPGEITLNGEIRSFSEKSLIEVSNRVRKVFETTSVSFGGSVEIEIVRENSGFKYSKNDPILLNSVKVIKSLGLKPEFKDSLGCYDANIFHENGIRVLNFGNNSQNSHTVNEFIAIKDLVQTAKLALALVTLSS